MRLQGLLQPLKENEKFISILNELKKKSFPIDIVGLSESGKSYIIDAIFSEIEDSLVVVTHNEIEAKNLYDDLSLYSTNVYFLPIREVVFYNVDAISGDLRWARLKVIKEILDNKNKKITKKRYFHETVLFSSCEQPVYGDCICNRSSCGLWCA